MNTLQQQCLLTYLGYSCGEIDGKMGSNTASAIKRFQQDYSLDADGICGTMTEKMLLGVVSGTVARKTSDKPSETSDKPTWSGIKYFDREEFRCKCGGKYCDGFPAEPSLKLIALADQVREHFGKPATVSSGLRCETWNAIQGGVANSRHRLGTAMDFSIAGVDGATLDAYIGSLRGVNYHYHIRNGYCHMDVL